jgi:hypothetical protein
LNSALVPILAALALGGCAVEWSRPDTTLGEYHADSGECAQRAWRQYPEDWGRGPGQQYEAARVDQNEVPRIRAYEACMTAKGYRLTWQRTGALRRASSDLRIRGNVGSPSYTRGSPG